MAWSIYAYLPFVWLGLILIYGLIRSNYEVGYEAGIESQKFDVERLKCKAYISDVARMTFMGNSNDLINEAHRDVAYQLFDKIKQYITFWRSYDSPRRITEIEGSVLIGKRGQ